MLDYQSRFNAVRSFGFNIPSLDNIIDKEIKADAIIVHSNELTKIGERRAIKGYDLLNAGAIDNNGLIILSGKDDFSDYLYFCISKEIERRRINKENGANLSEYNLIFENDSETSLENIKFSKRIIDQNDISSIIVVSSESHLPRLKKNV